MKNFWIRAFVLLFCVCAINLPRNPMVVASRTNLVMNDMVDQPQIVAGLERATTWKQTLIWWHGPWVAGEQTPFYRPLTSTIWWLEFRAFGGTEKAAMPFMVLHFLAHFVVCLLLVGFLRRLIGEGLALLSTIFWASSAMDALTLPAPRAALNWWKDDPDIWMTGAIVVTLWLLLSHLRTGRRSYLAWTFALQLVAISIKEMAYVLPLLALAVCWYEKRLQSFWPVAASMLVVTALAYGFRWWALQGPGFSFGTNGSWFGRAATNLGGGRPLNLVVLGDESALVLGFILLSACFAVQRRWRFAAVLAVLGVVGVSWNDWQTELGNFGLRLLTPFVSTFASTGLSFYSDALLTLILLGLWWQFFRSKDRVQIFAFVWAGFAYLPLLTAPITEHAFYLPSIGWAIWLAVAVGSLTKNSLAQSIAVKARRLSASQILVAHQRA